MLAHHSAYTLVTCSPSLLFALLRVRKQTTRLIGLAKDQDEALLFTGFGQSDADEQEQAISAEEEDANAADEV